MPSSGGRHSANPFVALHAVARCVVIATLLVVGLGTWTPAAAGEGMALLCDRADYGCVEATGYRGQSYWGANYGRVGHNCTSYVSYRLAMAGAAQPWYTMGNANQWDDKGRGKVLIDDNPAVGSVAQWEGGTRMAPGDRGHVGFVESVSASSIEVSDDSSGGGTRRYTIQRGSAYWPDNFIHIYDTPTTAPTLSNGTFTLATRDALQSLQRGSTGTDFTFGAAGEVPVVGNWDGERGDTVGTFRDGEWTLININRGDRVKRTRVTFGEPGDLPVVGDWDGDGDDTVGVFRDGTFLLSDRLGEARVDREIALGAPGDLPVAGDWDGDGVDTVGIFRKGTWVLSNGRANLLPTMQLTFGADGDLPVVGNWDGQRGDTVGVFRDGRWVLSNQHVIDPDELVSLHLGDAGDVPIVGAWRGQRTQVGIAR